METSVSPLLSKILKITNIKPQDDNLAYNILNHLYVHNKYSQSKISKVFCVQHQTIRRWLDRLEIPIKARKDIVSDSLKKYKRTSFSNDVKEKAYIIGLRYGDISTQRHGRHIRVYTGTTHPAMLQLFNETFKIGGMFFKIFAFYFNLSVIFVSNCLN